MSKTYQLVEVCEPTMCRWTELVGVEAMSGVLNEATRVGWKVHSLARNPHRHDWWDLVLVTDEVTPELEGWIGMLEEIHERDQVDQEYDEGHEAGWEE